MSHKYVIVDTIPNIAKNGKTSQWDDMLENAMKLNDGKFIKLEFTSSNECTNKSSVIRGLIDRRGLPLKINKRGDDLYISKK